MLEAMLALAVLNIYFFEINSKLLSGSEFWSLINEPNIIVARLFQNLCT